ncbi:MAG: NUDIX domain-containing protein [Candidatus Staskawiczbacteria bacterium]|nr:NUDIX domain-containing protein [Candidatus Staskawiczbacteria bacterium]
MEEKQRPKVGVGVMILNDKKEVLLGKRNDDAEKASSDLHGEGTWTMPGGKLDFKETLIVGAFREVFEETGIKIDKDKLKVISVADEIVPDNHYVTIGFLCKDFEGKVKIMEPEEITEWKWYNLNNLPEKVFPPSLKMIKAYLSNKIYN